jgi:lysine-specific demethylase 8
MEAHTPDSNGSVAAKEYMGNTSRVSILKACPGDAWAAHPSFKESVYPHSREAVLRPGDMLFMPPGWWHAMRGEGPGPGWSVSIWF